MLTDGMAIRNINLRALSGLTTTFAAQFTPGLLSMRAELDSVILEHEALESGTPSQPPQNGRAAKKSGTGKKSA